MEEFRTYFADGILSKEQLEEMFHQIDTHRTKWVMINIHNVIHWIRSIVILMLENFVVSMYIIYSIEILYMYYNIRNTNYEHKLLSIQHDIIWKGEGLALLDLSCHINIDLISDHKNIYLEWLLIAKFILN